MKQWLLRSVLVISICVPFLAISAAAQGGELLSAEYGNGNRRVDVTQRVRQFMHDGILRIDVDNSTFGIDPAADHVKELFIRIRHWDGKEEEFHFPEHEHVNLVLDPERGYEYHDRDLHIMRAFYGAGGRFVDVTEIVRRSQHDGKIVLPIDTNTMGGDPVPDVHKILRVLYWQDGQRRQVVVPGGTVLRLP
jgi:hypothetical protein